MLRTLLKFLTSPISINRQTSNTSNSNSKPSRPKPLVIQTIYPGSDVSNKVKADTSKFKEKTNRK